MQLGEERIVGAITDSLVAGTWSSAGRSASFD